MADNSVSGAFGEDDEQSIDVRPLLRLGAWGGCAVIALSAAVFAGRSDFGERRAAVALASFGKPATEQASPATDKLIARTTAAENEAKRLNETVRQFAAEREQLAVRLASLERNLDDLTGSIGKASTAPRGGSTVAAAPAGAASAPATTAATEPPTPPATVVATIAEPPVETPRQQVPLPRPAPLALIQSYVSPATAAPQTTATQVPAPAAAHGEFAVDLGGAGSVEALRTQWNQIRAKNGALLDGLQPLVSVRSPHPGTTERRLIVGPLANPTAVARVCAALSAAGTNCAPAVYDGQRLALR